MGSGYADSGCASDILFQSWEVTMTDGFDKESGNWLNEFFKIQSGWMVGVHAIMLFVRDKRFTTGGEIRSEWTPAWRK